MNKLRTILLLFVITPMFAGLAFTAQAFAQESKATAPKAAEEAKPGKQYSGMYNFLEEGEFVQITVEDNGRLTGFVSRYTDEDSAKGAFLEQYFRSGKLEGDKLTFVTETPVSYTHLVPSGLTIAWRCCWPPMRSTYSTGKTLTR